MAQPKSTNRSDNEDNKFLNNSQNEVSVRTVTEVDTSGSGPIEVVLSEDPAGTIIHNYAEALAVASSSTVTILTYTVPVDKFLTLKKVHVSGDNIAIYEVKLDGITIDKVRTYWDDFNATLCFENLEISASQTLTVEVENFRPNSSDFNAKFVGNLI